MFRLLRYTPLLALFLLAACGPDASIEDQVKGRIASMELAGENGERANFRAHVATGFGAQQGQMTRDDFRRFMFLQMNQRRRIQAQLFPITVTVQSANLAEARFKALVTGGGAGWFPAEGQLFNITTQWSFEDGEWMLWQADWEPIGP